jgi:hypothetical protein
MGLDFRTHGIYLWNANLLACDSECIGEVQAPNPPLIDEARLLIDGFYLIRSHPSHRSQYKSNTNSCLFELRASSTAMSWKMEHSSCHFQLDSSTSICRTFRPYSGISGIIFVHLTWTLFFCRDHVPVKTMTKRGIFFFKFRSTILRLSTANCIFKQSTYSY